MSERVEGAKYFACCWPGECCVVGSGKKQSEYAQAAMGDMDSGLMGIMPADPNEDDHDTKDSGGYWFIPTMQ